MITLKIFLKIFIIFFLCRTINCFIDPTLESKTNRDNYIDPHSIYYNKYTQQLHVKNEVQTIKTSAEKCSEHYFCSAAEKNDVPDELFSRKFVNLLLTASSFEENGNFLMSSITIELTKTELRQLKDFGLGRLTVREIDPIIANIFKVPEINVAKTIYTFIKELIFNAFLHKEVTLVAVVVLYITWIIFRTKWNMLKLILIILLSVFAASFILTWLQLLKEAEIKLTVKQVQYAKVPIQCHPHKMSWWDKLWAAWSSGDECKKYYEAMMENPFFQVTPAQALSHMIATCVLTPVSLIGNTLGDFVNNCTRHLWFPLQVIVAPLLIIGVILITVMVLIILSGGSLSWGFGPFSIFSVRGRTDAGSDRNLPSTDRQPIQPIYNFNLHGGQIHRIAINNSDKNSSSVDVKSTPAPSSPTKSIQLKNQGLDLTVNVVESATSLEIKEETRVPVESQVETSPEKSEGDKKNECSCEKKTISVSESGDS